MPTKEELQRAREALRSSDTRRGWLSPEDITDAVPVPPDTFQVSQPDGSYKPVGRTGRAHLFFGASFSGKTFAVAAWAAQELRHGSSVLWVDFEDQRADLADMMRSHGIHAMASLLFVSPEAAPDIEGVILMCRERNVSLIVLDATRGVLANVLPGWSGTPGDDIELLYHRVIRPLTDAGLSVAMIDHVAKNSNGSMPIGSERKLSACDVAIEVASVTPIGREQDGYSSLTARKYRGGFFPRDTVLGYLSVKDGKASVVAEAPVKPTAAEFLEPGSLLDKRVAKVAELVREEPLTHTYKSLKSSCLLLDRELFVSEPTAAKAITEARKRELVRADGSGMYEPVSA